MQLTIRFPVVTFLLPQMTTGERGQTTISKIMTMEKKGNKLKAKHKI